MCPIFGSCNGWFTSRFYLNRILATQEMQDAPKLTQKQLEAINLIEEIASEPHIHMNLNLKPGDLLLLNNHLIYHARTSFQDWPQYERKRHLLRLWLSVPYSRPLPSSFTEAWGKIDAGCLRGGVLAWYADKKLKEYQLRTDSAVGVHV